MFCVTSCVRLKMVSGLLILVIFVQFAQIRSPCLVVPHLMAA